MVITNVGLVGDVSLVRKVNLSLVPEFIDYSLKASYDRAQKYADEVNRRFVGLATVFGENRLLGQICVPHIIAVSGGIKSRLWPNGSPPTTNLLVTTISTVQTRAAGQ